MSAHFPPVPEALRPRIEDMIQDECPLHEIARTLGLNPSSLTHEYPEAKMPPERRGELAAMSRAFSRLPDTLTRRKP